MTILNIVVVCDIMKTEVRELLMEELRFESWVENEYNIDKEYDIDYDEEHY